MKNKKVALVCVVITVFIAIVFILSNKFGVKVEITYGPEINNINTATTVDEKIKFIDF